MHVPDDPPEICPACGDPYASVSRHDGGFVVNLLDNERYRRVCFRPVDPEADPDSDADAAFDCFHHTHRQTGRSAGKTG